MTRKLSKCLMGLMILVPLIATACGTTYSSRPPATNPGDLEGSRYETMRVLAGRLVDRLQGTRDELRVTREAESEMSTLATLIEKARRFRDSMENYGNPPRYVRDDVNDLDRIARDLESRTRNVQVSTRAYDNWRGALDVLDRMQRLLAGQDVDIPPATGPTGGSTYPPSTSDPAAWFSESVIGEPNVNAPSWLYAATRLFGNGPSCQVTATPSWFTSSNAVTLTSPPPVAESCAVSIHVMPESTERAT